VLPLQVIILDIRYPSVPITQLARHHSCVNALAWAPHSSSHLCTAGDDAQVGGAGLFFGERGRLLQLHTFTARQYSQLLQLALTQ
jgi:hypothetical protein